MSYVDRHEVIHPDCPRHRYVHSDRARMLEKFCQYSLKVFRRYLNTHETQALHKFAKRNGIE